MARLRFLQGLAGPNFSYTPGHVYDVPDHIAKQLGDGVRAVIVDEPPSFPQQPVVEPEPPAGTVEVFGTTTSVSVEASEEINLGELETSSLNQETEEANLETKSTTEPKTYTMKQKSPGWYVLFDNNDQLVDDKKYRKEDAEARIAELSGQGEPTT